MNPIVLLVCAMAVVTAAIECADGYTCFQENDDLVWVMKNDGNTNGPTCSDVCSPALCGSGTFHSCDEDVRVMRTMEEFEHVAAGLGFTCTPGACWDSVAPGEGMMMVSTGGTTERACYFPEEDSYSCNDHPGNANCFGERYSLVCPCSPRELEQACTWESPPNIATRATWPEDEEGISCLERINYWRKVACDEGWPECPPCGLPPMTECVACHECANSQSEHDQENGAHASFRRCGESVQGQGGGATCADVIDAFVSERAVFDDSNGEVVCRGHCGPIVAHGCQTFFWGRSQEPGNFYTLNWRSCNEAQCDAYCESPTAEECFRHPDSPVYPDSNDESGGGSAGTAVAVVLSVLFVAGAAGGFWWTKIRARKDSYDSYTSLNAE